jgi:hypothetical protein
MFISTTRERTDCEAWLELIPDWAHKADFGEVLCRLPAKRSETSRKSTGSERPMSCSSAPTKGERERERQRTKKREGERKIAHQNWYKICRGALLEKNKYSRIRHTWQPDDFVPRMLYSRT